MDRSDLTGFVSEDPGRPQGVAQVVAARLELRGEAAVEGQGRAGEDPVDLAQM